MFFTIHLKYPRPIFLFSVYDTKIKHIANPFRTQSVVQEGLIGAKSAKIKEGRDTNPQSARGHLGFLVESDV